MLLLTMSSLPGTPSPGPPRLMETPAAVHPLPQRGEGQGSEGVLSVIRWDRTLAPSAELFLALRLLACRRRVLSTRAGPKKLPAGRGYGGCSCTVRRAADLRNSSALGATVLSHLMTDSTPSLPCPSPLWGRGWTAAGVFFSRGGPGEGVSGRLLIVNNNMGQDTRSRPWL